MPGISLKAIYSVAKKEFADNVRNRWIVALTIIFVILMLLASYVAGAQTGGGSVLGGMEETVIGLMSIAVILIPLIAVMLGYASIAGECENGSMGILLSHPIRRGEILVGKLIGLGFVIVVSTVVGFGSAGILIAATVGAESGAAYVSFIGLTILSGFLYLSMAVLFSTIAKSRTKALGMGVVLIFWSMIYGMIIFGVYLATGGDIQGLMSGSEPFPNWLYASIIISPADLYQLAVMMAFEIKFVFGYSFDIPFFMTTEFAVMVQILWIELAVVLAYFSFKKRDI